MLAPLKAKRAQKESKGLGDHNVTTRQSGSDTLPIQAHKPLSHLSCDRHYLP